MNYELAAQKYLEVRDEIDRINRAAKSKVAELNKIVADLENWFTLRAQEDGLKNIPTSLGNAHWTTLNSATVAEPGVFKQFVIENAAWDLIDARAAKLAVKSYVEGHGVPPPGVNYASIKNFVFTRASSKE